MKKNNVLLSVGLKPDF